MWQGCPEQPEAWRNAQAPAVQGDKEQACPSVNSQAFTSAGMLGSEPQYVPPSSLHSGLPLPLLVAQHQAGSEQQTGCTFNYNSPSREGLAIYSLSACD